jgi:hypothetical protein
MNLQKFKANRNNNKNNNSKSKSPETIKTNNYEVLVSTAEVDTIDHNRLASYPSLTFWSSDFHITPVQDIKSIISV